MGNFIDHSTQELTLLGEDQEVIDNFALIMEVWESMADSGGAHTLLVPVLEKLVRLEHLSPLTDDPSEWSRVDPEQWPDPEEEVYQSLRNPSAFSFNLGLTYWLVGEPEKTFPTAKKQEGGSILEFPQGVFEIVRKYLVGDEVKDDAWDEDQFRILAWTGKADCWVVQFDVPSLELTTFYELTYDDNIEAGSIRTFERED